MKKINSEQRGRVRVLVTSSATHMMNAELMVELFEELYTPALKLRRAALGLGSEVPCLLMADSFTGTHSFSCGHQQRRERWADTMNVILPLQVPGGWSAKGQPCDQVFSHFKYRVRLVMDCKLGFGTSYFSRSKYEKLALGATGLVQGLGFGV